MSAAVLCGLLLLSPAFGLDVKKVRQLRKQAENYERQHDWDRACDTYEALLRLDRTLPGVRERYRNALRRYYQVKRHNDDTYKNDVLTLKYTQALRLYDFVLVNLLEGSLDKQRLEPYQLFRKGLEEFSNALTDPTFCQAHLRGLRPQDTRAFRDYLRKNLASPGLVLTREGVIEQVREVAMKALGALGLSPTTTVMEFTCGSCYAIDDYTVYLTPSQFRELAGLLKGEFVGVGIRLAAVDGKLVIDEILVGSPAFAETDNVGIPKVRVGQQVLSIDKKPVANLSPEAAMRLLEGEAGTDVALLVVFADGMARTVTLSRRAFVIPSVNFLMQSGAVGYVRITCFQETTLADLDNALADLNKQGMKALILDLRGNSGGLFDVAVETARRFLAKGLIVTTRHHDPRVKPGVYHAHNPAALSLPMVVLVDGETASAAEVVAGALKENKRARVVGQTTYGKGCSQGLLRLPTAGLLKLPPNPGGNPTGGIRLTVERFFSPTGYAYSGRGVVPHIPVDLDPEQQLVRALDEAQRLLGIVQ
jgi:carboxyl-terminal processing protease